MNYERRVYEALKELQGMPNLKGYDYTIFLVSSLLTGEIPSDTPIMDLYRIVAERFGCTKSSSERAIRHFVERIFDFADKDVLDKYLGKTERYKMPISYFIFALVKYIQYND